MSRGPSHDATGRSKSGRFVRLDHNLLTSPAYRSLSPNARSLLTELAMMENGRNNGELFLSVRDACDRMGVADFDAGIRAFDELEAMGFISCTREGHFAIKAGNGSRARCWRITWQSTPCLRIGPSGEYRDRQPEPGTRERKRMDRGCKALKRYKGVLSSNNSPVRDSATLEPKRVRDSATPGGEAQGMSVRDTATRFPKKPGKPSLRIVRDSASHTADQLESDGCERAAGHPKAKAACASATHRACEHCSTPFELTHTALARGKRFCSEPCRKADESARAYRRRKEAAR